MIIGIIIITIKDNTWHDEKLASTEKAPFLHIETSDDTTLIDSVGRKSFKEDCMNMYVCEERIQSTLIRMCARSFLYFPNIIGKNFPSTIIFYFPFGFGFEQAEAGKSFGCNSDHSSPVPKKIEKKFTPRLHGCRFRFVIWRLFGRFQMHKTIRTSSPNGICRLWATWSGTEECVQTKLLFWGRNWQTIFLFYSWLDNLFWWEMWITRANNCEIGG